MEPQGEQADFELRHWDGSDEDDAKEGKWLELLDLYGEIDDSPKWAYLRGPGIRLIRGDSEATSDSARIMIVGEAPGAVDNGNGKPFSGTSGEILEEALKLAGLRRDQCFITNVLKYRSRDNRPPGFGEALMAQEALRKEWAIISPLLTIAIGAQAHRLLNPAAGTIALSNFQQGELWTWPRRDDIYCTSMFHPAMGLRHPIYQERIEASWETLGNMIDELDLRKSL